jgi:hypothetical protein
MPSAGRRSRPRSSGALNWPPGHRRWRGDTMAPRVSPAPAANTYLATFVERHSRYVMLVPVAGKDTRSVTRALSKHIQLLPQQLRAWLTWDRGTEMADHAKFAVATDVKVYFCDPQSPRRRIEDDPRRRRRACGGTAVPWPPADPQRARRDRLSRSGGDTTNSNGRAFASSSAKQRGRSSSNTSRSAARDRWGSCTGAAGWKEMVASTPRSSRAAAYAEPTEVVHELDPWSPLEKVKEIVRLRFDSTRLDPQLRVERTPLLHVS